MSLGMINTKTLAAVLKACSSDQSRPALMSPWCRGGHLYASDSYMIVRHANAAEGVPDGTIAAGAIRLAYQWRSNNEEVEVTEDSVVLRVPWGRGDLVNLSRGEQFTHPDGDKLLSDYAKGDVPIGLNLELAARMHEAMGLNHHDAVKVYRDESPLRPIHVEHGNVTCALMPVRLHDEPTR